MFATVHRINTKIILTENDYRDSIKNVITIAIVIFLKLKTHGGITMGIKLYDSELKVMEILWKEGELTAGQIAKILKEEIGWNRNTTYTVIKKCIEKGAVERIEPKFRCRALISKKDAQEYETEELIDRMFEGSKKNFFAAMLSEDRLTAEELEQLKDMVNQMK